MKFNKASLAVFGGITAGFFTLGILYIFLSGGNADKTDVAIIFSLSATLLASWAALSEGERKKRTGKTCANNADTVTYYVP
jgi:hypothetical protein